MFQFWTMKVYSMHYSKSKPQPLTARSPSKYWTFCTKLCSLLELRVCVSSRGVVESRLRCIENCWKLRTSFATYLCGTGQQNLCLLCRTALQKIVFCVGLRNKKVSFVWDSLAQNYLLCGMAKQKITFCVGQLSTNLSLWDHLAENYLLCGQLSRKLIFCVGQLSTNLSSLWDHLAENYLLCGTA